MLELDKAAQGVPKRQAFENIPRNRHLNHKYHLRRVFLESKLEYQRYQKRRLMPVILRFLFTSFLVAAPMAVKAEDVCTIKLEDGRIIPSADLSVPAWETGSFNPLVEVGTVLQLKQIQASGPSASMECDWTMGTTVYTVKTGSEASWYGTFKTPIAGVGIRIRTVGVGNWWPHTWFDNRMKASLKSTENLIVELVKTGPITAGGYITGQIGEFRHVDHQRTYRRIILEGSGIAVEPNVPTCKLDTPLVPVYLESTSVSDLMDGGKGPWKDFNLSLTCFAGQIGATTRVFIVISDSHNPANRSTTLSLSRDSVAKNVGIEIQRENEQLVSFGPETGDVNQWMVGEIGENNMAVTPLNIKLKARYTSTSRVQEPTPGSANADATFVISYK
ncbi:type 1 fimbrial protein [Comamonas thiooxydans]|uniref:fimbrial protein n=1 Tax=Comamonas thiooxydans TaxID=363952 RepID=UPI000AE22AE5|nr:fimbrial protein [Comamonas thiooxydans]